MPSPGYGAPSQVRGLHPTGLRERLVFKISDLNDLNPKNEGAVISRRIGARKKLDILRKAQEMNLKIISVKDPSNLEKKIVTQLEERKKQRSKRIEQKEKKLEDKKKAQEKSKSEEKESMKPDDQKTGVEEKIVQEEEKQKIEKEIAHKVITKKTAK